MFNLIKGLGACFYFTMTAQSVHFSNNVYYGNIALEGSVLYQKDLIISEREQSLAYFRNDSFYENLGINIKYSGD